MANFTLDTSSDMTERIQRAVHVARQLQQRANQLQTPQERRQQAELDRMMHHPSDKVTLTQLTDQAFRSSRPHRAADQLVHILDAQGIPRFFTPVDRMLLRGFQSFGNYLPGVAVPLVKEKMQEETANVILPAEQELLTQHLRKRHQEGVRMNVNFLGEALLGEEDAKNRLRHYLQALQLPEIEVMSVKISTIFSQISSLAEKQTLRVLGDRLELLFRAASKSTFTRRNGVTVPKFVYLDMEEYRDMSLTSQAFMQTLDRPGLEHATAGIVLQAYIPDSFVFQRTLTDWARARVDQGGAPITLRIVKGANMEMERFEASLQGWPQAPYRTKPETDANYKRMLDYALVPENLAAVRIGVASHNLFELAYALVLTAEHDAWDRVQFEMLEGMANHQRRALFERTGNMLLYAPACKQTDFIHAIGYLVRRLDENTGPDNFLRHAFHLEVGTEDWQMLERQFAHAFRLIDTLSEQPRRTQDRQDISGEPKRLSQHSVVATRRPAEYAFFDNEPDTDFALPQNVHWAESIIEQWHNRHGENALWVRPVIAGEVIEAGGDAARSVRESHDPSRPGHVVARYIQANSDDVQRAVACAGEDQDGWRQRTVEERSAQLAHVASAIRRARGDLLGIALAEGGKLLTESDPEASEAVDFVEFYRQTAEEVANLRGLRATGRGVVVVVSPWNFPIAIPCGGIAAALAAGNTVILKPASDTIAVAQRLCECFWDAGISERTLQFVPCAGATIGQQLVSHPDVDTVILTGGTETALTMLHQTPRMRLLAETGGKNATIVTALADRDQAIRNVIHSAFSHSGQKCSATSLLILEDEVFYDEKFKETLCDAIGSLKVGSAWELDTRIGPLIRPPSGVLEKAFKELEPGESWAVLPGRDKTNPHLYSPAVKWGVRPGSFTHMTEFFGPVLGVMRARDLYEAIRLVNETGYGLTSGLESLDDREHEIWKASVRAGNLYINRGTTGAVVLRQPFGGMGKSAFGPGIKAGGPNYVVPLMRFAEDDTVSSRADISASAPDIIPVDDIELSALHRDLDDFATKVDDQNEQTNSMFPLEERNRTRRAMRSYSDSVRREFGRDQDPVLLIGQDNLRRYLPVRELRVRVHADDSYFEILARVSAAKSVGCRTTVSFPPHDHEPFMNQLDELTRDWAGAIEMVEETDDDLIEAIAHGVTHRIRYAHPDRVPVAIRQAAAPTGVYIADEPVLAHGRIELLWYVEEQSVSSNYHRYGNLGERAEEPRRSVL
ncbi:MAG: proline dehydrogenase family protein [Planctomycetales bacterium]|nr:proline dehydrogenase family protein [Planctomycetales bacterium]